MTLRPLLSVVVAIALLGQGAALAAAPLAPAAEPPAAVMPCHGDAADAADDTVHGNACECCDGDCQAACGAVVLPSSYVAARATRGPAQHDAAPPHELLAAHTVDRFRPPPR